MPLFQASVLKKYLKAQDKEAVTVAFEKFKEYFHNPEILKNIRDAKEEQFQEGFLRELFVNVLGYTLNPQPNYNLTTELKNEKGAKKADGAILENNKALAVIELKGTNTKDLDKINNQAFNYKNNHSNCVYVVTSNFEKLRFFIQNAVEHIEFNLFTLTEDEFRVLWLCLQKDNLFGGIPLKAKEESLLEEEKVTKQLYKDYSEFKTALWQNMVKNQPDSNQLELYKKAQKLLDRFLFIFFAEDKGLLPPNSISKIIKQWEQLKELDEYRPLYDRFKKYFGYLNTGWKGKEYDIYAYNGGLFYPDEILDSIDIDDEALYAHVNKLTNYDFETEVDVNILGHIFEHSLNDIEQITAELEGREVDKGKSKRKKDGVFYTPKYITKYIVENTVGKLCEEKKSELNIDEEDYAKGRRNRKKETIKKLDTNLQAYRKWLLNITICDPACGSGAFLNQALEFLIAEHTFIDELESQLLGYAFEFPGAENHILEKNLYGVDINEESVEIARLSLWLRTAKKGRKLSSLNKNIKCGNSLIDDPKVAGDKAFKWEEEFPDIFVKKENKAWHITSATHNSRYSQRMFDNYVKLGEPVWLSEKEEIIVTETIAEIVEKDNLKVIAYNICGDHIHLLLLCTAEELPSIVQKIKAMSARACNIAMGRTVPAPATEHAPSLTPNPSLKGEHAPQFASRGKTQYHLWTQKFGSKEVAGSKQLENTINYIVGNRKKHELPSNKELESLIKKMTFTARHVFQTEYKGGFDVVIGNPPYVRQELFGEIKPYLEKKYDVYEGTSDLFSYFYEKSFKLLKSNIGLFGFISNTFDKTTAGVSLREYLQKEVSFLKYIDFTEVQIFEGVTTYPVIIIAKNIQNDKNRFKFIKIPKKSQSPVIDIHLHHSVTVEQLSLEKSNWSFKSKTAIELISKLKGNKTVRELYGKCYYGVKTALNEAFIIPKRYEVSEHIKPIYEGKELSKWISSESVQQLVLFESKWTKKEYGEDVTEEIGIQKLINDYPKLISHILPLEERAKKRYDQGDFFWELRNCAYYDLFEKPKVVFPNLQNRNKFSFDETGTYINAPAVILPTNDKFLIAIFNSKLVWYFLTNICVVRSGGYIEVKPQYFEQIPIPKINNKDALEAKTNTIIDFTSKMQKVASKFTNYLQSQFSIEKLPKKLQDWHELEFGEFIKELNKAIKKVGGEKLTKMGEMEWMEVFETKKAEAQTLKAKIDRTDKEIDKMVYELYGLSEEEIKIVEEV